MNIDYFSIIVSLCLFVIIIISIIKKKFLPKPESVIPMICFIIGMGILTNVLYTDIYDDSLDTTMHIVNNYIENSIEESDKTTEIDINKIIEDTLSDKLKKSDVSSYTNKKSQTKVVNVNIRVGNFFYCDFEYEFLINLKTKEIRKPTKLRDIQSTN